MSQGINRRLLPNIGLSPHHLLPLIPIVSVGLIIYLADDLYRSLPWFANTTGNLNRPLANSVSSGLLTLMVAWFFSIWFTGELSPLAIARRPVQSERSTGNGERMSNTALSLSKLQTLLYFLIVITGYVMIVAYRYTASGSTAPLPAVPLTVLGLLGLSVGTSLGTQALSLRYQQENRVPNTDRSDLIRSRDGSADLTKLQMLLWTLVGITTYGLTMLKFLHDGCYTSLPDSGSTLTTCQASWTNAGELSVPTLPSFDPLLLMLAGVVQGTFFAGRVLNGRVLPRIDGIYRTPDAAGTGSDLRLLGTFPGVIQVGGPLAPTPPVASNIQIEIGTPGGPAQLIDLRRVDTISAGKLDDQLTGKVSKLEFATAEQIKVINAVGSGTYQFRVGIDGVWSEPTIATI